MLVLSVQLNLDLPSAFFQRAFAAGIYTLLFFVIPATCPVHFKFRMLYITNICHCTQFIFIMNVLLFMYIITERIV
jgi:hypothetical protein